MIVYIVERGGYDDHDNIAVYLDEAMAQERVNTEEALAEAERQKAYLWWQEKYPDKDNTIVLDRDRASKFFVKTYEVIE